jgi:hypothetical protein
LARLLFQRANGAKRPGSASTLSLGMDAPHPREYVSGEFVALGEVSQLKVSKASLS